MAVDTTVQVTMPQMGESVTEGTVLEWHKREGDTIEADEVLVEISTDKVDAEVPSPTAGTVVKLLVAEGDTVTVGQPLAELSFNGGAPPAGLEPHANGDASAEHPDATAPTDAAGETVDIVAPAGGESVTEGTILEWHVVVGDTVAADDTVVELSTDKVDMELPAPAGGTITEILAQEGETVTVGQTLARLTTSAAAPTAATSAVNGGGGAGNGAASAPPSSAATPVAPVPTDARISPVAARVAAAEGVDVGRVAGSGPAGRIVKADVLAVAASGNASGNGSGNGAGAAGPGSERTLIKGGAATLARYMDESRAIPTATSFRTITVTTMDGRRKELKAGGQKVSFTHLIAYAISLAATQDMPVMAHHFNADEKGKPYRVDDGAVNLGVAVDVQKKDGSRTLMVPVIRDAGRLNFKGFLDAFSDLIARARDNTLTADDLTGANVSLTNPGGIGTIASVPRLMTGQGTIIATGSIAYPVGLGNIGDMIGAEKVMTMTSTYDHRVIQGAESGQFLAKVEEYLQGEHGFYEGIFASVDVELGAAPAPPAPAAAAAAARETAAPVAAAGTMPSEELLQAVQAATSVVKAHRTHGHLAARLDPLGTEPEGDPALNPETVALTPELMAQIPAKILRMHVPGATLADALPHLHETYCGTIAYEVEHIASHRQRIWLREKIEAGAFRKPLTTDEQKALLRRLVEVDAFERFMHKAYLGSKQFSVEGLDMTVPMIDEAIQLSAAHGGRRSSSAWPTAAASTCWRTTSAAATRRSSPNSKAPRRSRPSRRSRRAAPAT